MTDVGDLVVRLRGDSSDLEQSFKRAETAVQQFASVGSAAVGGTFVAGIAAATEVTRNWVAMTEQMGVQFGALMGSGKANDMISQVEQFSQKMGVSTASMAAASKELQILTQGLHNSPSDWKAMSDAAAVTGQNVATVADEFGRAFSMLERSMLSGSGGGVMAIRQLLGQGLISPGVANDVQQLVEHGASMNQVWDQLISGTKAYQGAADAAANTMHGLITSFHDLFDMRVGESFRPIEQGLEGIIKAVNNLLRSDGVQQIVDMVSTDMQKLGGHFDAVVSHVNNLASALNGAGFSGFLDHLKAIGPELAVLGGLMSQFGASFLATLPVIGQFATPFKALVEDGRGGLLGLVLASAQGREGLMAFAHAVMDLVHSLFDAGGALSGVISVASEIAGVMLKAAAGVIEFVAHHHEILAFAAAIFAVWEAIKIGGDVVKGIGAVLEFFDHLQANVEKYVQQLIGKTEAENADNEAGAKSMTTNRALAATVDELTTALEAAANAQRDLNNAQSSGSLSGGTTRYSLQAQQQQMQLFSTDTLAAQTATRGRASLPNASPIVSAGSALEGGLGIAAIGGGIMAGIGTQIGGPAGTAMTLGGSAIGMAGMGAAIGSMIEPGGGTLVGGALGAAVGGLTALFTNLGSATENLTNKIEAAGQIAFQRAQKDIPQADDTSFASLTAAVPRQQAAAKQMADDAARQQQQAADFYNQHLGQTKLSGADEKQFKGLIKLINEETGSNLSSENIIDQMLSGAIAGQSNRAGQFVGQAQAGWFSGTGGGVFDAQGGGDASKSGIAQSNAAVDAAKVNAERAKAFDDIVAKATGLTTEQVDKLTQASQIKVDYDPIKEKDKYDAAMQAAVSAASGGVNADVLKAMGGFGATQMSALASSYTYLPGARGLQSITGAEGERRYTMPASMIAEMAGPYGGAQNTGILDMYSKMIGDAGGSQYFSGSSAKGFTGETNAQLDQQAQLIQTQDQLRSSAMGLRDAWAGLSNAQFGLADAEHAGVVAANQLAQAHFALSQAQFQLQRTQFQLQVGQASNADAMQSLNAAMVGHQDSYQNFDTIVMQLADNHRALVPAIQAVVQAAAAAQNVYDDVNLKYKEMSDQLTILTDKQKEFQDVMNRPLQGETAFDKATRANQNQQDAVKLQMDQLRLQGVYDKDPRMTALQYQLNVLQTQADQIATNKDATIGNEKSQIQFASQANMEIPFQTALKAAQAFGELNKQIIPLQHSVDAQKVAVDQASAAYDKLKARADLMVGALDKVAQSDQNLIMQHNALITATNGVVQAMLGIQNAQFAVTDADHNIANAHLAVRDAADNVRNAEDQSQLAIINAAKTANSQAATLSTQAGGFMSTIVHDYSQSVGDIFKMAIQNLPPPVADMVTKWIQGVQAAQGLGGGGVHIPGQTGAGGSGPFADGGIESHDPQISGIVHGTRIWNEPETGGEAYIPLGPNKRSQALPVLQQVNQMFGLRAMADGGVIPPGNTTLGYSNQLLGWMGLSDLVGDVPADTNEFTFMKAFTRNQIQHDKNVISWYAAAHNMPMLAKALLQYQTDFHQDFAKLGGIETDQAGDQRRLSDKIAQLHAASPMEQIMHARTSTYANVFADGGIQTFGSGGFAEALANAQAQSRRTGIPVSVMLTQSANETGHWTSQWYVDWNNPAGIGVTGAPGAGFKYPTPEAGWFSYAQHLLGIGEANMGKFVADLSGGADPIQLLADIQASGWAAGGYGGSLPNQWAPWAGYDLPGTPRPTGAELAAFGKMGAGAGGGPPGPPPFDLASALQALPLELGASGIAASALVAPAVDALSGLAQGMGVLQAFSALAPLGALGGMGMFADGGIATRPTLGVFGEAGPEALIPLDKFPGAVGGTTISIGDGAIRVDITVHGNAPVDEICEEVHHAVHDALDELVASVRAKVT